MFEDLKHKINLVKAKIASKRAKKHCVTYNQSYREKCLFVNELLIKSMLEARKSGDISDDVIDTRNVLAVLNSKLANGVAGDSAFIPKPDKKHINPEDLQDDDLEYSSVVARMSVKLALEAGADVKGIFYGVYDDDNEDDLVRLTINGLSKGLRLWPIFFDGNKREDHGLAELSPVFVDIDEIYDQCYSIGELATLYSHKVEPEILGMLMRADADFLVRTAENHNGTHAFAVAFFPKEEFSVEKKKEILEAYKKVYTTKENLLSAEQRQVIVDVMKDCVDENCTISQKISKEDRAMIQDALNEITCANEKADDRSK